MTITKTKQGDQISIRLPNKFNADCIQDFRDAYTEENDSKGILIDFRETEYMDSSGLGMLIHIRREFGEERSNIKLINCRSQIKRILLISRFDKYFEIS